MKKKISKYKSLIDSLKQEIRQRTVGSRFYNQEEIMKKYKLSYSTVSHALQELVQERMLIRITGQGTFIQSLTEQTGRPEKQKLPELVLSFSEPTPTRSAPWNWFIHAKIQQGVCNSYPERCQICTHAKLEELLRKDQVPCVIVINPLPPLEKLIEEKHIPYITIRQDLRRRKSNALEINHMPGMVEAVNYLVRDLEMKRIAMISTDKVSHADRVTAFRIALQGWKIELPKEYLYFDPIGAVEGGAAAMAHLLSLPEPPEAVIADTDLQAWGVLNELKRRKIAVPEKISVIGFDNLEGDADTEPPLTSIDCSYVRAGEMAVEMLLELLESGEEKIPCRQLQTKLVIRESCRDPLHDKK